MRISVLAEELFRLEYSEKDEFLDNQTLGVVCRDFGQVDYTVCCKKGRVLISTAKAELSIKPDGNPFSKENVSASFEVSGKKKKFVFGMEDSGNLRGTARTLDGYDGEKFRRGDEIKGKLDWGKGLLSRDGWSYLDDTKSVKIVRQGMRHWVAPRADENFSDGYLFLCGHHYKRALQLGAKLLGNQPLIPRYALGYWYSRYWAYTDGELRQIVEDFDRYGIPLDVLVVDMDWHLPGWTGYTWDRRYFPDPDDFMKFVRDHGLKMTLNLHPAQGVGKHEEMFPAMAKAMGADPEKCDNIPFDITSQKYMKNYFEILHHPQEKKGVDFWWMDWQQGDTTPMKNLDTLPWLNQLHWEDMIGRKDHRRPLIFSRFGGIGAGRYAVGFSGDTWSSWESLALQGKFTATAANVLFGYWSHDIGGHLGKQELAPELYLRWIQYGVFSPVLRTHTSKNPLQERRIWYAPEPYRGEMIAALQRRYELAPYIYSEIEEATRSAVSLCHPLYYEFPEDAASYRYGDEYFFGRDLIAAPVTAPADETTQLTKKSIYLPPGEWYDVVAQRIEQGGKTLCHEYLWSETPLFSRAGGIIPGTFGTCRLGGKCLDHLLVTVCPGEKGEYSLYEDDGISDRFQRGESVRIQLAQRSADHRRTLTISRRQGSYDGFQAKRALQVCFPGSRSPKSVSCNGKKLVFGETWFYRGATASVEVALPDFDLDRENVIELCYGDDAFYVGNIAPVFRRLARLSAIERAMCNNFRLAAELESWGVLLSRAPRRLKEFELLLMQKLPVIHRGIFKDAVKFKGKTEWVNINVARVAALVKSIQDFLR